jgi:hypothetical protein
MRLTIGKFALTYGEEDLADVARCEAGEAAQIMYEGEIDKLTETLASVFESRGLAYDELAGLAHEDDHIREGVSEMNKRLPAATSHARELLRLARKITDRRLTWPKPVDAEQAQLDCFGILAHAVHVEGFMQEVDWHLEEVWATKLPS